MSTRDPYNLGIPAGQRPRVRMTQFVGQDPLLQKLDLAPVSKETMLQTGIDPLPRSAAAQYMAAQERARRALAESTRMQQGQIPQLLQVPTQSTGRRVPTGMSDRKALTGASAGGNVKQDGGFLSQLYADPSSARGKALQAAAATALQLSGYQDRPITTGQVLGAMMQSGSEAYEKASEERPNFQVVGGSLIDLSDPSNPKVVYSGKKDKKSGITSDAKFTFYEDDDGNIVAQRSDVYDDVLAAEEASRAKSTKGTLSSKAQASEDDDFYAIDTSSGIVKEINKYVDFISQGELEFGLLEGFRDNLWSVLSVAGEEEILSAQFDTFLEKLRNDTLRLNKGVQTEGDAQRALNEIIKNKNDGKIVKAQLERLSEINSRAIAIRKRNINRRRSTQNVGAFDFTGYDEPVTPDTISYKVVK